jgi:hypothetical protein
VLEQTEDKLRKQWQVNIVGSQDGYFRAEDDRRCLSGFAQRGENRDRGDGLTAPGDPDARLP